MSLIARYFRKILLVAMTLSTLFLPACFLKTNEQDIVTAPPPTISGAGIITTADVDNARIRCGFKSTETASTFDVVCHLMVVQNDGSEGLAMNIKENVGIQWQGLDVVGETTYSCPGSSNSLTRECSVTVDSIQNTLVTAKMIVSDDDRSREVMDSIDLSFSVRTYGATLMSPNLNPLSTEGASGLLASQSNIVGRELAAIKSMKVSTKSQEELDKVLAQGFQIKKHKATLMAIDEPTSMCTIGKKLYFSAGNFVYVMEPEVGGDIKVYAGKPGQSSDVVDHPLKLSLTNPRVACDNGNLVIASSTQIVKLGDGRIEKIKNINLKGTTSNIAGQLRAFTKQGNKFYFLNDTNQLISLAIDLDDSSEPIEVATLNNVSFSNTVKMAPGADGSLLIGVPGEGTYLKLGSNDSVSESEFDAAYRKLATSGAVSYRIRHQTRQIEKVDSAGATSVIAGRAFGAELSSVIQEGEDAAAAQYGLSEGVAFLADGSLIVADTQNHRIRKIDAITGKVTTIAGTGEAGFSGDGSDARVARINKPMGIVVAADQSIYFADSANNRVRKIDTNGVISSTDLLVALPSSLAIDSNGIIYAPESSTKRILRFDPAAPEFSRVSVLQYYAPNIPIPKTVLPTAPVSIAIGPDGIYYTDSLNKKAYRLYLVAGKLRLAPLTLVDSTNSTLLVSYIQFMGDEMLASYNASNNLYKLQQTGTFSYSGTAIIGGKSAGLDCGTVNISKKSGSAVDMERELKASLSQVCSGRVLNISVKNSCAAEEISQRRISVAFPQIFANALDIGDEVTEGLGKTNIVTFSRPCTLETP